MGVPEMDAHHKHLVALLNRLHTAMAAGQGRAAQASILDELAAYTVQHFEAEEAWMKRHGYARLEAHKAEHARLAASVRAYVMDLRSGKIAVTVQLMQFLKEWLVGHILGWDKDYGRAARPAHGSEEIAQLAK